MKIQQIITEQNRFRIVNGYMGKDKITGRYYNELAVIV